jgi:GntR family transcriptional regulator / MocR family aminotransferase
MAIVGSASSPIAPLTQKAHRKPPVSAASRGAPREQDVQVRGGTSMNWTLTDTRKDRHGAAGSTSGVATTREAFRVTPDLLIDLASGGGRGVRERLEQALRSAIQQRRLRAGADLPPSRVLASDLGIARSVVVEAYRNLAANGYLETRRGGWTRVRP